MRRRGKGREGGGNVHNVGLHVPVIWLRISHCLVVHLWTTLLAYMYT